MGKERGEGGVSEILKSELREGERREGGREGKNGKEGEKGEKGRVGGREREITVRREGRGSVYCTYSVGDTIIPYPLNLAGIIGQSCR